MIMKKKFPLLIVLSSLFILSCADRVNGIHYDGSKTEEGLKLNRMVSDMADRLFVTKVPGNNVLRPIAVASFVDLKTLDTTNALGEQLAEDFIHELHRRGEVVLDYKVTGHIRVTPDGDFTMSREWTELSKRIPAARILTGTMSKNKMGVVLNMRVINMRNRMVEATAQGFVPNELLLSQFEQKPVVLVTKGMVVRGDYPIDQYGRAIDLQD